jgi:hypothetical protein
MHTKPVVMSFHAPDMFCLLAIDSSHLADDFESSQNTARSAGVRQR